MKIEDYFQQIREAIDNSPVAQSSRVDYNKRNTAEGFIRGEVYLVDGSILHLREFVDVEITIDRVAYAYQYMSANHQLIFRYDDTAHHKNLNLPTYPHHKHDGSEDNNNPSFTLKQTTTSQFRCMTRRIVRVAA